MKRIEVNIETGEVHNIDLTSEEIAKAQQQYSEWQVQETIRLAQVAKEEELKRLFEEWLKTQS